MTEPTEAPSSIELVPAVVAVVPGDDGRVCLVRDEKRDQWTLPMGRIEPGESVRDAVVRGLKGELSKLTAAGHAPLVLVGPQVRLGLREIVREKLPKLTVMSLTEVTRDTDVEMHGQLAADALRSAAPGADAPGSPLQPGSVAKIRPAKPQAAAVARREVFIWKEGVIRRCSSGGRNR